MPLKSMLRSEGKRTGLFTSPHLVKMNERIVIDGSHIDQKKRGIFDMKEVYAPLLKLLTREEFRERYGSKDKDLKILVY